MKSRTVAVIGLGPVGGILAAHLSLAGHTVLAVDSWEEHLDSIKEKGLRITGREELTARPDRLYSRVGALGEVAPELVFICTKGCDLGNVLDGLNDKTRQSGAVFVAMQNGIDTEQALAESLGRARVLRAVITYGGVLVGPGEIRETFFNPPNYVGRLDESARERCREVAAMVSEAGLEMEATEEIGKHVWKKAILNTCTMAPAALTGMNMQELVEFPPTARLVELLLEESIATAAAYGFDYGPGFKDAVEEFNLRAGPHRPSMLVDIEKGRLTENPFLIRRIAEYAEKKGVPAPVHRTMANLIEALEMREALPSGEEKEGAGRRTSMKSSHHEEQVRRTESK